MKKFKNIKDFAINIEPFAIPFECAEEVYLLRLIDDPDSYVEYEYLVEVKIKYPNFDKVNINSIKNIILKELKKADNYIISEDNEIYHLREDIPDDMVQCPHCGNIYDGFAQCC